MPKSKRAKVVALTKVKKKTREWKEAVFEKVHKLCDDYPSIYVFKYHNMRNDRFKELREDYKGSCAFMLASTKKLAAALGRCPEDEYKDNVHKLTPYLRGHTGLLFSKLPHEEVKQLVEDFQHEDYARAGARATQTFSLPAGPLLGPGGQPFPHTLEHTFRSHGMPTKMNKGVIELIAPYTVCTEGKPLNSNQSAILRHFQIKMAVFKLKLVAVWRSNDDDVEEFSGAESDYDDEAPETEMGFDDGLTEDMMLPEHLR